MSLSDDEKHVQPGERYKNKHVQRMTAAFTWALTCGGIIIVISIAVRIASWIWP